MIFHGISTKNICTLMTQIELVYADFLIDYSVKISRIRVICVLFDWQMFL